MPLGVTTKPTNRPGTLLRCVSDPLGKHYSDDPLENFILGNKMTYKNKARATIFLTDGYISYYSSLFD